MKAAILYANDDIRWDETPTPSPGSGGILVKVKATGICGSDVPRVLHNGAHNYPIVLGHEFSGEVAEIGEGVTGFEIGDRVTGAPLLPCLQCADCQRGHYALCKHYSFIGSRAQGSFAEYVVLPQRNAVKFEKSVSFEQAAFFEPGTVALHGLRCNEYAGGGDVAIAGGGTIGLFTMQWAKIFGAKSVTVIDISEERLALAKSLGADAAIRPDATEKNKYQYVFETAGQPDTMRLSFELAANKAHVCFIGTPTRDLTFTPVMWENMNRKEFKLTGSWMSYSAPFPGEEWTLTAHFFATGQLKYDPALVFRKYPLSQCKEAFDLYKNPSQVKGKILFEND